MTKSLLLILVLVMFLPSTAGMADPFPDCIRECSPVGVYQDVDPEVRDDGATIDVAAGAWFGLQGVGTDLTIGANGSGPECGGSVYYGFNQVVLPIECSGN